MEHIRKFREKTAVKICGWASLPFFPLFCLFVLDYFNLYHYSGLQTLIEYTQKHPLSVLFEILIMLVLMVVLLLICRKAWIACGILGFFSLLFAFINFLKIALNGDNFYPKDIAMAGDAGELASFITVPLPVWFYLAVAVIIVWTVVYALFKVEIPLTWKIRLPSALAIVLCVWIAFLPSNAEKVINRFGMYYENTVLQSSNYKANGFVGAFTLNILIMQDKAPEGYSKAEIDSILSDYETTEISGELYDVVVVLNESFFDIRMLHGLDFSENPLSNYDEIIARENCYSGSLYTTALGGGTVRPEFEMLTGLSTDYMVSGSSPWEYVDHDIDTYVSNYKEAGYSAIALHPYDEKFYSRSYAYPYVGFDEFYGQSDLAEMFSLKYKRGYVTDASTLEAMEYFMDNAEDPMFLFTITMQNHQAYNPMNEEDITVTVSCDTVEQGILDSITTYTQGLYDADKMLGELCDYIDSRERPTILVFFGDHLPTLGSNYGAYNQTGFVDSSNGFDREEAMRMFSTPFIIYSNRDIDISIFDSNTENEISPYNVLNAVALATDFRRTPYMNLLLDFYEVTPMYNVRLHLDENEEIVYFTKRMQLITYDRTSGKGYSLH
ncbi:MAG: LTA synthase family protein [Oscillospiraceae bacterium]